MSVVAACASLLAAIFTYVFQRAKDVELDTIQKRKELELAERRTKQENYTRVLERLAPYIREPTEKAADFTTAYLHTWVVGSHTVLKCIYDFLNEPNDKVLDALLRAMRADLTLESEDQFRSLTGLTSEKLFLPIPPSPGKPGMKRFEKSQAG